MTPINQEAQDRGRADCQLHEGHGDPAIRSPYDRNHFYWGNTLHASYMVGWSFELDKIKAEKALRERVEAALETERGRTAVEAAIRDIPGVKDSYASAAPISADEFIAKLVATDLGAGDTAEALREWAHGDYSAAMEGLL